jgi:hypothetical protein
MSARPGRFTPRASCGVARRRAPPSKPGIVRSEMHAPFCSSQYNLDKEARQVQPGTRLGPYEVVTLLGARGMFNCVSSCTTFPVCRTMGRGA